VRLPSTRIGERSLSGGRAPGEPIDPAPVLLVGNFLATSRGSRFVCEDLADRFRAGGRSVVTTSTNTARLARIADMLVTTVRARNQYAVAQVDVFSGPAFVWADATTKVLKALKKPLVLVLRGGNLPEFASRWPGRVRSVLERADAVVTPSPYLRDALKEYRADLEVIGNPIDAAGRAFRHRDRPLPRLVWVRAFHEVYNPLLIPKVLHILAAELPDVEITMVGRDKGDGSLQRMLHLAQRLGVADRIQVPGGVPKAEVPKWLDRGDIFLNTARIDNTPISVLEAMAGGLCVVSTSVGGIPYLLSDEHDALLVPAEDPAAMATSVRRLLREPGLGGRLSSNGRGTAEQFDWSVILPRFEHLLDSLAAGRLPRGTPEFPTPAVDSRGLLS
jgi:glycosyltransferase involved in cell wall biosynthesis